MPTMDVSNEMLRVIKKYEGYSGKVYVCPAGKRTIGHGHVLSAPEDVAGALCIITGGVITWVKIGKGINEAIADALLRSDIKRYATAVQSNVAQPITQFQFDALVSLCFNIGTGAFIKSTLLRKLNAGDYEGALAQFARWNKGGGKVLKGLVKRREHEARIFDTGAY